jgi:hypothetical protein
MAKKYRNIKLQKGLLSELTGTCIFLTISKNGVIQMSKDSKNQSKKSNKKSITAHTR